ncbi:MAG: hypothetical protein HOU01_25880 [Streptomycetaceae bacterium]|nr:hypothetical protein [Streptomycetaceae bacterium]
MTERPYETTVPDDLTSGASSTSGLSTGGSGTTSLGATSTGGQGSDSTASAVGQEAKSVASDAAQSGRQVADTAASGAKDVVSEATTQLRQLFDQLRSELDGQASSQGQRAVGGLRSLADELREMASGSQQQGIAGEAAHQAADRASSFADWLDNKQPGDILDEVRSLARRRPGAFLLGAAAIGVLGGRMTRGLTGGGSDQQSSGASGYASTAPGTTGAYPTGGYPTGGYTTGTAEAGTVGLPPEVSPVRSEPYTVGVRDTDTHGVTTATDGLTADGLTDETQVVYVEGESEARG